MLTRQGRAGQGKAREYTPGQGFSLSGFPSFVHSLQPTGATRSEDKKIKGPWTNHTVISLPPGVGRCLVSSFLFLSGVSDGWGGRRDGTPEIPPRYEHAPFPHGERQRGTTIYLSGFLLWWRRGVRMGEGGGRGPPIKNSQPMCVCVCCVCVCVRARAPTLPHTRTAGVGPASCGSTYRLEEVVAAVLIVADEYNDRPPSALRAVTALSRYTRPRGCE